MLVVGSNEPPNQTKLCGRADLGIVRVTDRGRVHMGMGLGRHLIPLVKNPYLYPIRRYH